MKLAAIYNIDYEKELFELQEKFRTTLDKKYLTEIYELLGKYCIILYKYLKIPFSSENIADIIVDFVQDYLMQGRFVEKSWKSLLIPFIKGKEFHKTHDESEYNDLLLNNNLEYNENQSEKILESVKEIINFFIEIIPPKYVMPFLIKIINKKVFDMLCINSIDRDIVNFYYRIFFFTLRKELFIK